jgi:hypothetical protein
VRFVAGENRRGEFTRGNEHFHIPD